MKKHALNSQGIKSCQMVLVGQSFKTESWKIKNSHHIFAVGQVNAEGFGGAQQKDQQCLGRGMEILLPPQSRVGNDAWGCYSRVGVIRLGKIFSGAWQSPFHVDSLSRAYEE